jgi:hypothetical protein
MCFGRSRLNETYRRVCNRYFGIILLEGGNRRWIIHDARGDESGVKI